VTKVDPSRSTEPHIKDRLSQTDPYPAKKHHDSTKHHNPPINQLKGNKEKSTMTDYTSPRIKASQRHKQRVSNTLATLLFLTSASVIAGTAKYAVAWNTTNTTRAQECTSTAQESATTQERANATRQRTHSPTIETNAQTVTEDETAIIANATIPDGSYVMCGSYTNQENMERIVRSLREKGYTPKMEATLAGTRVLLPYTGAKERQLLEEMATTFKVTPVAIIKNEEQDHYLPPTGPSSKRYTSITEIVRNGDIKIEELPYYKKVKKAIDNTKTRYDIHDERDFAILAYAVMWKESDGKKDAVSTAGAVGPMQVLYPTEIARLGFGKTLDEDERLLLLKKAPRLFDLDKNIADGIVYLAEAVEIAGRKHVPYSEEHLALAGAIYNMGDPNVKKGWHRKNPETINYMAKLPSMYNKVAQAVGKE